MLIRYHLIYYALGCLLVVLSLYHHYIFWVLTIIYLYYIFKRLDLKYMLVLILCMSAVSFPRVHQNMPLRIQGSVIKTSQYYCDVLTDYGTVRLYHDKCFQYRDRIDVRISKLEMKENTNDYGFCERLYLYGQNIFYKAKLEKLISIESHQGLYHWLEKRFDERSEVESYQRMFVLGEKNEDMKEDYDLLSKQNLVHLFALSGMHIHILSQMLEKLLVQFINKKYAKVCCLVILGVYIFSIPMQISLYRAYFCMLLSFLLRKWLNALDILSLLTIVSLIYNPYIIYNISFVFSYFIYFVVLITKQMSMSAFFIYLAGLPIVLCMQHQIPLLSFIVGWILSPFIELLYIFSFLSTLFPMLSYIEWILVDTMQKILLFLEHIQGFLVLAHPTLIFLVIYYILYFQILYRKELKQSYRKTILMMISLILSFSFYSRYKIYGEVTMIDVGQGDCTLIRLPLNQGNILIDTGGDRNYDLAMTTIIPYLRAVGIERLDYVYISHDDYDHCGALESLVKNFSVKHVIREYEKYRRIGCMEVTMLNTGEQYTENNDCSLIMKVDLPNMSLLFMGDASFQVEIDLKKKYKHLDIDVLKVSHHGSQTSSSTDLFEMISPSIAMIGVKKNNVYHHPSKVVIDRLERKKVNILRTDLDGMFHIRFYGKERYILN